MKVFPRTPHLSWSGHRSSDDLTLTTAESESFLQQTSVVQEKLDGANVSIRVADGRLVLENRGKPVSNHAQFDPFKAWVAMHQEFHDLGTLILYGEWLYAEHGTPYDQLPDYFIAYDLYDTTTERFLRSADVSDLCGALGVSCVPELPFPDRRARSSNSQWRDPGTARPPARRTVLAHRGERHVRQPRKTRAARLPATNQRGMVA